MEPWTVATRGTPCWEDFQSSVFFSDEGGAAAAATTVPVPVDVLLCVACFEPRAGNGAVADDPTAPTIGRLDPEVQNKPLADRTLIDVLREAKQAGEASGKRPAGAACSVTPASKKKKSVSAVTPAKGRVSATEPAKSSGGAAAASAAAVSEPAASAESDASPTLGAPAPAPALAAAAAAAASTAALQRDSMIEDLRREIRDCKEEHRKLRERNREEEERLRRRIEDLEARISGIDE